MATYSKSGKQCSRRVSDAVVPAYSDISLLHLICFKFVSQICCRKGRFSSLWRFIWSNHLTSMKCRAAETTKNVSFLVVTCSFLCNHEIMEQFFPSVLLFPLRVSFICCKFSWHDVSHLFETVVISNYQNKAGFLKKSPLLLTKKPNKRYKLMNK